MQAGRELDALVAEKVVGIEPWPSKPGAFKAKLVPYGQEPKPCLPPNYSTDIAAAWEVVLKLRFQTNYDRFRFIQELYQALDIPKGQESMLVFYLRPDAICLAALKAVGALTDEEEK